MGCPAGPVCVVSPSPRVTLRGTARAYQVPSDASFDVAPKPARWRQTR